MSKKIFIWEYLSPITRAYHPEGGVAVIAKDLESAWALLLSSITIESEYDPPAFEEPTWRYKLKGKPRNRVFLFPDSGCC